MSHDPHRKYRQPLVIAVDGSFLPVGELTRRKALKAMATGRAQGLDLRTWARLEVGEVAGRALKVVVFPHAKAIAEARLARGPAGRRAILRRDGHTCMFKGCDRKATTLDHLQPRSKGGRSTYDNLVACCHFHNQFKGDRSLEACGLELKHPIRSPRYHLLERFHERVRTA